MAYQIDKYNKDFLTNVEDGTIDQTTDLKFIGKNYAGYGEIQNENFLFLLENFAGANPPPRKVTGQVWFDTGNSKLKFWDGTNWRTTGGAAVSATAPSGLTEGDFWWDSANEQLYGWNGSEFILVGPQNAGAGLTQMQSRTVIDTSANTRTIIAAVIEEEVVYIISPITFTIDSSDPANAIDGFSYIRQGLTLKNTTTEGITTTNHRYWGTASTADGLLDAGGTIFRPEDFLQQGDLDFSSTTNAANFPDNGITVGTSKLYKMYLDGTDGVIENGNGIGSEIIFRVTDGNGDIITVGKFNSTGLIPPVDGTFDIGSTSLRWRTVFADRFEGIATKADTLLVGSTYRSASASNIANTVVARDASGDIAANNFQGTATSAKYADLAEKYSTDEEYPVGTVMAVGGEAETRAAKVSDFAIGVISEEPAFMMNSEAEGQYIGLKGRVPVRVQGPVSKGQAVYAWENGVASTIASNGLVGIALETNNDDAEKLVECVLKV